MHCSLTCLGSQGRFSEAYSTLSKVWTTAHIRVQKGKGSIYFICDKITFTKSACCGSTKQFHHEEKWLCPHFCLFFRKKARKTWE